MPDPIFGDENPNTITSTYASDTIFGLGGNDILNGGYGADSLFGGVGNDRLSGGEGFDFLFGEAGDDQLDGGTGADVLNGGAGKDKIFGGAGDDMIQAVSLAETIGDTIDGGSGVDTLFLSLTTQTAAIRFTAKDPILVNQFGTAFSITGVEQYQIFAGSGDDMITGYLLSDSLFGGKGNDTLKGLDGADFLQGGDGNDTLFGGNDADFIGGDAGNDSLNGDAGHDFVQGGTGADRILGGTGDDTLVSGTFSLDGKGDRTAEIDELFGQSGNDRIEMGVKDKGDGGVGSDTVQLDFVASRVGETFTFSSGAITFASGGSMVGFETLEFFGGLARDTVTGGVNGDGLFGGGGSDILNGGAGNDRMDGGVGNDVVRGQDGNDLLTDSLGADRLFGDAGDDLFQVGETNGDRDAFDGGAGIDTVDMTNDGDLSAVLDLADQTQNDGLLLGDTFRLIEKFIGTDVDDFFFGDAGGNKFYGADGDDVLDGRAGNDYLHGGEGSDTFTGGAGRDIFDLSDQSLHGPWFGDIITDFVRGEDKIQISLEFLGLEEAPTISIVSGNNPAPTIAGPQLLFDQATDRLFFDLDGTGTEHAAMLVATVENAPTLTATDFMFS